MNTDQIPNRLSDVLSGQQIAMSSWSDFQEQVKYFAGNRGQWCFRGQSNAGWGLQPSLERLITKDRIPAPRVEKVFLARFKRQAHHYLQTLPDDAKIMEWLALMQHWGVPTRLLDFTLSPYVGLYFAIVDMKPDGGDSALWAIRYSWMNGIAGDELPGTTIRDLMPDWGTNKEPLRFHDLFDAAFKQNADFDFVAPVQPFIMNERLAVQQGMFLCPFTLRFPFEVAFVQPPGFQTAVQKDARRVRDDFARKLVIAKDARPELLRELHRMNISSASLFPGLAGFAQSLGEAYSALENVDPRKRDFELSAIEDFGWAG